MSESDQNLTDKAHQEFSTIEDLLLYIENTNPGLTQEAEEKADAYINKDWQSSKNNWQKTRHLFFKYFFLKYWRW